MKFYTVLDQPRHKTWLNFEVHCVQYHINYGEVNWAQSLISTTCITLHGVSPCVSSNFLSQMRRSHTCCICLAFLHCVFSNDSSNGLPERMHSDIGCICWTFLHGAFLNVSIRNLGQCMQRCTACICLTFLHCAFSNVSSKNLHKRMQSHIGYIYMI